MGAPKGGRGGVWRVERTPPPRRADDRARSYLNELGRDVRPKVHVDRYHVRHDILGGRRVPLLQVDDLQLDLVRLIRRHRDSIS